MAGGGSPGLRDAAAAQLRIGADLLSAGRLEDAETCHRRVVALDPSSGEGWLKLGAILGALGRAAEAAASLREAARLLPASADAHGNLGNALRDLGEPAEAARHLREALRLRPDYPEAHNNLGALLRDAAEPQAAEHFEAALRLRPGFAEAHANLGRLLLAQDRPGPAEPHLRAAAERLPRDAALWLDWGAALRGLGRPDQAAAVLRRAMALGAAEAATQLGNVLYEAGQAEAAAQAFRHALDARPRDAAAALGLGVVLTQLGAFDPAEALLRRLVQDLPASPEALTAFGDLLRQRGRLEQAEAALRQALRLRPEDADAQVNLAFTLLQAGRLAEGWAAHEHRHRARAWRGRAASFAVPRWQGEALGGRTLLVHAEQGLGDSIQFCRFLDHLRGDVVLRVQPPLVALLAANFPRLRVLGEDAALPPVDLECPLLGLPHRLGDVPARLPYLHAPAPERRAGWLAGISGLRVGLVWAGNPGMAADRRRSIPLALLRPLGEVPGVSLVSLQLGPAASQAPPPGLTLHRPEPGPADFADTANLVAGLDLVIGVDTAVIHLAGAMGRPAWLLNRHDTCWRWGATPGGGGLYDSLVEFRQLRPGNWEGCIEAVRDALARLPSRNHNL